MADSPITNQQIKAELRAVVAELKADHPQTIELSLIQKVMVALFIAGCVWVGGTVQSSALKLATLEVQIKTTLEDRYTGREAQRDFQRVDGKIEANNKRLDRLEGG
jgi:hypothetical protein